MFSPKCSFEKSKYFLLKVWKTFNSKNFCKKSFYRTRKMHFCLLGGGIVAQSPKICGSKSEKWSFENHADFFFTQNPIFFRSMSKTKFILKLFFTKVLQNVTLDNKLQFWQPCEKFFAQRLRILYIFSTKGFSLLQCSSGPLKCSFD